MSTAFKSFDELYKERKDWVESSRKNGFEDGILNLLTELYPDNAHFIYELLQNAEDAEATEIHFSLSKTSLLVKHNAKRHFTFADVNSITSIGKSTKKDDIVQIGKFGVGFKAVFSYTNSPRVFSKEFSFEIRDLVIPERIDNTFQDEDKTTFEFPFNNGKKTADSAFEEIQNGLDNLSVKVLLFLQNIKTITWEVEKKIASISKASEDGNYLEIQKKSRDKLSLSTHWLRFNRPLEKQQLSVSIAYKLDFKNKKTTKTDRKKELKEQFKLVQDSTSNVSVYFPAEKETSNLYFNINAPFSSTVARDSLQNRPENDELIEDIASLAGSSLHEVKKLGLLTASFFEVLPNTDDNIPDFYLPIQTSILQEFKKENLVPCQNNSYLASNQVYESPPTFRNLFSLADLKYLVSRVEEKISWLVSINGKRQRQFISDLNIRVWGIQDLYSFLEEYTGEDATDYYEESDITRFNEWLLSKDTNWLKTFYRLLLKECESANEYGDCPINEVGSFAILLTQEENLSRGHSSYFPMSIIKNDVPILHKDFFPIEHSDIDLSVVMFFKEIGVKTYGDREKINLILEQNYRSDFVNVTMKEHISHMQLFINYFLNSNDKMDSWRLFRTSKIIHTDSKGYMLPGSTYLTSSFITLNLEHYFETFLDNLNFAVCQEYLNIGIDIDVVVRFLKWVGCLTEIKIEQNPVHYNPQRQYLLSAAGQRNYNAISQDYTIKNLTTVLDSKSFDVTAFMISALNNVYKKWPYAYASYKPNKTANKRYADSFLLFNLKSRDWISTKDGTFVSPAEVTKNNIHPRLPKFTNKELIEDICLYSKENEFIVVSDEKLKKAQALGFETTEKLEKAKWFANLAEIDQHRFYQQIEDQENSKLELPNSVPSNPGLRQKRVLEDVDSSPLKQKDIRSRSVSIGNKEAIDAAKEYLISQYTNSDGVQICQICEIALPFRKLNGGAYYFEAIEYSNASGKSLYQNYLCLCPNHAAMWKHANEDLGRVLELLEFVHDNRIEVSLAGSIESIYITATHLLDLKTVLHAEKHDEYSKSELDEEQPSDENEVLVKRKEIIKQFNADYLDRVKILSNWKNAHLRVNEDRIWCLGTKNMVIAMFLTEEQAREWWSLHVIKTRPDNPRLILN